MNITEIIKSVDELIFEIVSWIVLIPKTIVSIIKRPSWAYEYINCELKKKPEDRFEEYVSPIICWLVCCVIPYLFITTTSEVSNMETHALLVALFLSAGPIGFATSLVVTKKETLSKSSLKVRFYIQCYLFIPFYILLLFILPDLELLLNRPELIKIFIETDPFLYVGSVLLSFVWLITSEITVIRSEFDYSFIKSAALFFLIFFASYIIFLTLIITLSVGQILIKIKV